MPTFLSLNVKGLNHPTKRTSMWHTARESNCYVICLQEMHLKKKTAEPQCTNRQFTHIFQASGPTKRNWVMIAFKNSLAFTLHNNLVDEERRYLAPDCTLDKTRYTIVSVYTPNSGQLRILSKLMKKLTKFHQGCFIVCSDFNVVPDNNIDTSSRNYRLASPMGSFIRNNDLYDVWRCHHTTEGDYSFFSHRHNSYTRIDYFLVDKWTLTKITDSSVGTITWSDHAPVSVNVADRPHPPRNKIWRANAAIIQSPEHSAYIRKHLEEFFDLNEGSTSNNTILWNAHKAFIRGIIIQLSAREKRRRSQYLDTLTSTIKTLDEQNQNNPDPKIKEKLVLLRQELRNVLLDLHTKIQTQFRAKQYSTENKAGKALALRLKGHHIKTKIPHLFHPATNQKLIDPQTIADAFSHYYQSLYKLKDDLNTIQPFIEDIDSFLQEIKLTKLSQQHLTELNEPFTPPRNSKYHFYLTNQ